MNFPSLLLAISAAASMAACASSTTPRNNATTRQSSPDYVTSIEVGASSASNAYELITRLRPRWLQAQAPGSLGGSFRSQVIAVYLDGIRLGNIDALRSISTSGIKTMQFYDATRAATVLRDVGSTPIAGAINITTTRVQ